MQTTETTQKEKKLEKKINISEIKVGDIFSEENHLIYKAANPDGKTHSFKHLESGELINLSTTYIEQLLQSADQVNEIVEVGKEDKYWTAKQIEEAKKKGELASDTTVREGDVRVQGIRSIWANIHSSIVFEVSFNKQSKEMTAKALNEAKNKQLQEALTLISSAATAKKGVAKAAEEAIKNIQENPVVSTLPGEERVLRGYKVSFVSTNGVYDVVDMDIENTGKNENLRKVNINEINYLAVGGVKYIVKQ